MPRVAICPTMNVAVTVDHQPRQSIRLAEYQPVVQARRDSRSRSARATLRRCTISERSMRLLDIPSHDAAADERMRIHIRMAEELIAIGMNAHWRRPATPSPGGVAALSISLPNTQGCPPRMRLIFVALELVNGKSG